MFFILIRQKYIALKGEHKAISFFISINKYERNNHPQRKKEEESNFAATAHGLVHRPLLSLPAHSAPHRGQNSDFMMKSLRKPSEYFRYVFDISICFSIFS